MHIQADTAFSVVTNSVSLLTLTVFNSEYSFKKTSIPLSRPTF